LALGCNIFNLGFFPCFVAYPFIYRKIVGDNPTQGRLVTGATVASVVGLQLGALSVILETLFSGISELPFGTFLLLMQPIHLGIGVVEGFATAAVVTFVWKARPEVLEAAAAGTTIGALSVKKVLAGLAIATVVVGGVLSWFASTYPDGLEWSMFKVAGSKELESPEAGVHGALVGLQEKTAFLPDYSFKTGAEQSETDTPEHWPAVDAGTTVSGLVGGVLTLLVAGSIGVVLKRRRAEASD